MRKNKLISMVLLLSLNGLLNTGCKEALEAARNEINSDSAPVYIAELYAGKLSEDSFTGLDVDWSSKTALLAVSSGTNCVSAVDISDYKNPKLFHSIGTATAPSTSGRYCRSVKFLEGGTKFIVPTYDKHTEVWTFGGNVRDPAGWSELSDLFTSTEKPKRLSQFFDKGATYEFLMSTQGGLIKASLNKTSNIISILNEGTLANDPSNSLVYQDAAYVNEDLFVATVAGTNKSIQVFSAADSTLVETITLNNAADYMWSSAVSGDQKIIAIGGKRLALLSYDSTQAVASNKVTLMSEQALSVSMRHMEFFTYRGIKMMAGACSNGSIRFYNVDDLANPILVKDYKISAFDGEAYDLDINGDDEVMAVVGTKGKFAILSINKIL
jgi:hypothetical protein